MKLKNGLTILFSGLLLSMPDPGYADVSNLNNNGPRLRLRVGNNAFNSTNTVIFEVPGNILGTAAPVVSTNNTGGGSGAFTVRIVTDTRRLALPANALFFGNSSTPMSCVTPATCGAETVQFSTLSWDWRDGGDTMALSNSFNNTNQLLHNQFQNSVGQPGTRQRDWLRFSYDNVQFLPAGTYRGTVNFTGTYQ